MKRRSRARPGRFARGFCPAPWVLALGVLACDPSTQELRAKGDFGVFFGGEIQLLKQVVWDPESPSTLGFRIELRPEQRGTAHRVHWELVRPGERGRRITQTRELDLPAGRQRLDQVVELPPSAPLGTVNVRVLLDAQVIIDRAVVLRRR